MTSNSQAETLRLLRGYLVHVETWDPECGDTFLMFNAREWLEDHLSDLDDAERASLAQADADLHRLDRETDAKSLDTEYLRKTVKVVNASTLRPVAHAA